MSGLNEGGRVSAHLARELGVSHEPDQQDKMSYSVAGLSGSCSWTSRDRRAVSLVMVERTTRAGNRERRPCRRTRSAKAAAPALSLNALTTVAQRPPAGLGPVPQLGGP